MRRVWTTSTVLLGLSLSTLVFGGCKKSPRVAPVVVWMTNVEAGLDAAKAQNKPALLFFDASWDYSGVKLERETFVDPAVNDMLARDFITVKVDCTDDENPEVSRRTKQFQIVGLPALIVLRPDAQGELGRLYEFMTASKFLDFLRRAKENQKNPPPLPKPG